MSHLKSLCGSISNLQIISSIPLTYTQILFFNAESERSSTLDTLPEGKQVYSGSQSNYRKVFPDWKPSSTIDKTDVVGAMEAVEGINIYTLKFLFYLYSYSYQKFNRKSKTNPRGGNQT